MMELQRVDIHDNPRLKKRFYNQVPLKFPKTRDDRVSNPSLKKEEVLLHQTKSLLVPSEEKVIYLNDYLEQAIVLVEEKVGTKFDISEI